MIREPLYHDTREIKIFKRAAKFVRPCEVLLDVGAGIRPQRMVECKQHICVEPHGEYADVLEHAGYTVIRSTAVFALEGLRGPVDTIVALDVLEHMTREEGARFIRLAQSKAREQVVILTPHGFMKQGGGSLDGDMSVDPWGMQGQQWQEHRSGWLPAEFPGWIIVADKNFNDGCGGFFAIWDAPETAVALAA